MEVRKLVKRFYEERWSVAFVKRNDGRPPNERNFLCLSIFAHSIPISRKERSRFSLIERLSFTEILRSVVCARSAMKIFVHLAKEISSFREKIKSLFNTILLYPLARRNFISSQSKFSISNESPPFEDYRRIDIQFITLSLPLATSRKKRYN